MESITRTQAKKLFEEGRTILVRPQGASENDVILTLHLSKSEFCPKFPDDKIEVYQDRYVSQFGRGLIYFVEPLAVVASWVGNGYRLVGKDLSFVVRVPGKAGALVKYVNSRMLRVTNAGSLTPDYRRKLKSFS